MLGFGLFVLFIIAVMGLAIYFIPTIIALARNHKNKVGVFLVNLLAGWTFFGWIGSLVWSVVN
jgi:hypothetical protein